MKNPKSFLLLLLVTLPAMLFCQAFPGRYWVQFKDKNNSPFSIANPSAFLSQRAIDRRLAQGINISENDLPVNPSYVNAVATTGAVVLNRSKWFNSVTVLVPSAAVMSQINALSFVNQVEFTAPVMKNSYLPSDLKDDKWKLLYSLNPFNAAGRQKPVYPDHAAKSTTLYNYGDSYNQIQMLNGDLLHNMGYRGQGMVIAVIDAGFHSADVMDAFDSLWQNNQVLGVRDFAEQGGNVFTKSTHGSMVLSTMGGNLPGELIGTAPKAQYWLLRSEDEDSEYLVEEDNWVSAAEFADSAGADIINSSLGYSEFNDPSMSHVYQDLDGNTTRVTIGADLAASKGMIVVNSAGNSASGPWHYILAPADGDSVLTAGSVNFMGVYSDFSSTGPTADGRVKPDVATQGEGTIVASTWGGGTFPGNGTSFASPVLAGMVACLWQANPGLKNTQVIQAIQQSASQHNNPDSLLGYGIPDFHMANLILGTYRYPDFDAGEEPRVYPNPAGNVISIEFLKSDTQTVSVDIVTMEGKTLCQLPRYHVLPGENNIRIALPAEMTQGMYFLTIRSGSKTYPVKFIKN